MKYQETLWVQAQINRHGFGPVEVDGDYGEGTQAAVRQFQAANDLVVDGDVGPRTRTALTAVSSRQGMLPVIRERRDALLVKMGNRPPESDKLRYVLTWSLNDLGRREYPYGANRGNSIMHLVHNPFKGDQSYAQYAKWADQSSYPPWCALAVCNWIAYGTGATHWGDAAPPGKGDPALYIPHPFPRWFGAVAQIEDWANETGRFHTFTGDPGECPPGAIFTMARGKSGSDPQTAIRNGHTGLVIADEGDHVVTIEGNTGNAVETRRREKTGLRGWVRWW